MTIDRDTAKVLEKVDTVITNAGYPEYRDLDIDMGDEYVDDDFDPEEKFKSTKAAAMPAVGGVAFVEAESVSNSDDRVHYDSGIPKGLKEAPAG